MRRYSTLADQSHGSLPFNSEILLTVWSGGFPIHPSLKVPRPLSVICPTHSSVVGQHFGLSLCPVTPEWEWRYTGLVWRAVQHLIDGGGRGWGARRRWQHLPSVAITDGAGGPVHSNNLLMHCDSSLDVGFSSCFMTGTDGAETSPRYM